MMVLVDTSLINDITHLINAPYNASPINTVAGADGATVNSNGSSGCYLGDIAPLTQGTFDIEVFANNTNYLYVGWQDVNTGNIVCIRSIVSNTYLTYETVFRKNLAGAGAVLSASNQYTNNGNKWVRYTVTFLTYNGMPAIQTRIRTGINDITETFYSTFGDSTGYNLVRPVVQFSGSVKLRNLKITDEVENPITDIFTKPGAAVLNDGDYTTTRFNSQIQRIVPLGISKYESDSVVEPKPLGGQSYYGNISPLKYRDGARLFLYNKPTGKKISELWVNSNGEFHIYNTDLSKIRVEYDGVNVPITDWFDPNMGGVLSGVYRIRGREIPNARIRVYQDKTDLFILEGKTDTMGKFYFYNLNTNQTYTIMAEDPDGKWEHRVSSKRRPV